MKKISKKLGAVVLALCMCFSLCCTALVSADDDEPVEYTITISNAKIGQTYSAYKIFDATVELDSEGKAVTDENGNPIVAYSISDDNPIYQYVTAEYYSVPVEEGEPNVYYNPFVFTKTTVINGVTTYTVTVNSDFSDTDIINFLNAMIEVAIEDEEVAAVTSKKAESNGELVLTLFDPGYYFVTSTLGSIVSITTTDPHAVILEKNDVPGVKKEIKDGLDTDEGMHGDTEAMGDDVEFLVTANAPLYSAADADSPEGYLVTDYEFSDHMSAGLEIRGLVEGEDEDYTIVTETVDGETVTHYYATQSLINKWVTVYDNDGTARYLGEVDGGVGYNVTLELTDASTYTEDGVTYIQFDGFFLSYYTIPEEEYERLDGSTYDKASDIPTNYPTNATVTIDYTAHVTDEAEYDNTNEIAMVWHVTTFLNPDTPEYGGDDIDSDDVYVLQLVVSKVDGNNQAIALPGAEFALTGTNLNDVVTSTTYTYTALTLAEYQAAVEQGTELWWKLVDTTTSTDNYTSVNPYDLPEGDPDLDKYVYDDQPSAPENYHYVAYVRTETNTGGLQPAADSYVTGVTGEDGTLTFTGLTEGDWTLREIKAPDGYNLDSKEYSFNISVTWTYDEKTDKIVPVWSFTGDKEFDFDGTTGTVSITVLNNSGTELPGTGGIGTTIFYIIGGVLVVGAGVVLVTRRRVNREG